MNRRLVGRWMAAVAVVLTGSVAVAVWWVMGQQVASDVTLPPYDYMFEPPSISPTLARLGGWLCVVLAIAAAVAAIVLLTQFKADVRWIAVLVPALAAGAGAGFEERIVTAAVGGANIGGSLLFMFGSPILAAMLVWSVVFGAYLLHTARRAERTVP